MNKKIIYFLTFQFFRSLMAANHPFQLGLETFYSNPSGSLNGSFSPSTGLGGSLLLMTDLGGGHGVRCDLGSNALFSDKAMPGTAAVAIGDARLASESATVNYVYHFDKTSWGPFLLLGVGTRRFSGYANLAGDLPAGLPPNPLGGKAVPSYTRYACDTGYKLAFQAGAGYDFRHGFGVIVRYQWNRSLGFPLATVETGVNYRF